MWARIIPGPTRFVPERPYLNGICWAGQHRLLQVGVASMENPNCFYISEHAAKEMALRHDPSLQTRQKAKHVYRVHYTFAQLDDIIKESGIDYCPVGDGPSSSRGPQRFMISYSKDKFFLDPSTNEVRPKDPSKYIMSHRGWDWKAAPHHTLDWYKHCEGPPPAQSGGRHQPEVLEIIGCDKFREYYGEEMLRKVQARIEEERSLV